MMKTKKGIKTMFRPIRRQKREIDTEIAKELLAKSRRGVLAVNGDGGYPYAMPVNYLYDEESGRIFFHGARAGHKFESIQRDDKVCFTVYGNDKYEEGDWAPYVQSTIVFGRCHLIENQDEAIELVTKLAKKYYPDESLIAEEVEKYGQAVQMFEISIEHLSGKMIHEK
ncbi:MAG: pyridoxamine 5'-phosphate oxidase family protein [Lachnospiraceae bacterium]|nr:pyridoxamine 5'-phosphate oxidase family protein [Lachnospiraceae bacterium]